MTAPIKDRIEQKLSQWKPRETMRSQPSKMIVGTEDLAELRALAFQPVTWSKPRRKKTPTLANIYSMQVITCTRRRYLRVL